MPIDYKKYPPNWLSEIRPRILKRAQNSCEFCLVKNYRHIRRFKMFGKDYYIQGNSIFDAGNGDYIYKVENKLLGFYEGHKLVKIILTIAHLDHDESNWEVKDCRLKALCQRCHIRYDVEEKKRRKKQKQNDSN